MVTDSVTKANTENNTREVGTIMTTPAMQSLSIWNRFTGGNWEILEMWARGGWKWSLMEDSGRRNRMPGEKGRQRPALKVSRQTQKVLGIELEVIHVTV